MILPAGIRVDVVQQKLQLLRLLKEVVHLDLGLEVGIQIVHDLCDK